MDVSRRGFLGGVVGGVVAGGAALPAAAEPGHDRPRLDNRMRSDHAWERFLAEQDLRWHRVPRTWYEGPFLGNGFLGSMVYQEPARNALRFTVHHSQVQDHRPSFGNEWGVARLPVGNLTLEPVGEITGANLRLDLWHAELRGTVTTSKGRLDIRAFIESGRSLLAVTIRPSAGERSAKLVFTPAEALSPRTIREDPPPALQLNPPPESRTEDGVTVVVQPMVAGGQTATAYTERSARGERTLYLTVAHTYPATTAAAS